jgi:hypothetical protein
VAHDAREIEGLEEREKQEQPTDPGAKRPRGQVDPPDIGDGRGLRFERGGPFVIAPPREAREALLAHQHGQGIDADRVTGGGEFPLDVIDGEIPLPHRHREGPDAISDRRMAGAALGLAEEGRAARRGVAKLRAQDAERAGRIAEPARHRVGGLAFDEERAERFVLPVEGLTGLEEEAGLGGWRYLIPSTVSHIYMMAYKR